MDHADDNLFQVSVKGMFFDEGKKLMMIQEKNGLWELPGGRMQKDESFIECLKRECQEETGLECEVLDRQPSIVYSTVDGRARNRIMLCYRVQFSNLNFKRSDECVDIKFFTKDEIRQLSTFPQLKQLADFL